MLAESLTRLSPTHGQANVHVHTVGVVSMLTLTSFEPDQHWLPFVHAVLLIQTRACLAITMNMSAAKIHAQAKSPYVNTSSQHRSMYHPVLGVRQCVLPFFEYRQISNNEAKRQDGAEWPSFERNEAGELARIAHSGLRNEVREWCMQNCRHRFHVAREWAIFESRHDAAGARIMV